MAVDLPVPVVPMQLEVPASPPPRDGHPGKGDAADAPRARRRTARRARRPVEHPCAALVEIARASAAGAPRGRAAAAADHHAGNEVRHPGRPWQRCHRSRRPSVALDDGVVGALAVRRRPAIDAHAQPRAAPQRRSCMRPPCCARRARLAPQLRARGTQSSTSRRGSAASSAERERDRRGSERADGSRRSASWRSLVARPARRSSTTVRCVSSKSACSSSSQHRAHLLAHHRIEAGGVLPQLLERLADQRLLRLDGLQQQPDPHGAVGHGAPQGYSCPGVSVGARPRPRAAAAGPRRQADAPRLRSRTGAGAASRTRRHSGREAIFR